jgi:hypothetical protein
MEKGMDWEEIAKVAGSVLAGSTVGDVASAIAQAGKIINHFLEDDPVKMAKAEREYLATLDEIIRKVGQAKAGTDVSDWIDMYVKLLDEK